MSPTTSWSSSLILAAALAGAHGCGDASSPVDEAAVRSEAAVAALSWRTMRDHVEFLADDALAGRVPGSAGHLQARDYLVAQLTEIGVEPFGDAGTYLQTYPARARTDRWKPTADGSGTELHAPTDAYNVVARLPGRDPDLAHEHIVIMAHYDHLGVSEDGAKIFNGAFDDAGGTAVVVELARALVAADATPRRSVIFLITDEEESGLRGAEAWIADPPIPKADIVMGLSADPIGRNLLPDYGPIILCGLEHSPSLLERFRETASLIDRDVIFVHREMIPLFASDQDTFYDAGVPAAWFITPGMSFYHTANDTADTLDYRNVRDAARYLARVIHHFGESAERFPFVGPAELAPSHAADVKRIVTGLQTSALLDDDQRDQLATYGDALQAVVDQGTYDALPTSPRDFFLAAVGYAAFALPLVIPGDVPPPEPVD